LKFKEGDLVKIKHISHFVYGYNEVFDPAKKELVGEITNITKEHSNERNCDYCIKVKFDSLDERQTFNFCERELKLNKVQFSFAGDNNE